MKFKTCVSIAETTPSKTKKTLKIALLKSDYAEVRFDFLKIEQIPETL
ncbi:MAG: type I 3-dehydroquinate dehydratase, partial [Nitrosopumilus sp.]|nr:type I 3-dehydroquinate dehydratase [Nitrosopumilus sp.]